jgi:aspartyl protease family protein
MTGDNIASVIYLALLGAVIAGYFLVSHRRQLGKVAQQALIWVFIFVGIVAAVGLWEDVRSSTARQAVFTDTGAVIVPMSRDGHYHLTLDLNGTPVRFIVDTGATEMVLSLQDAQRIGIDAGDLRFIGQARTANGAVATAPVWLDEVRLGGIVDRDVPARVSGGEMPGSLLGMGYLHRFSTLQIADGKLTLIR